MFSFVYHAVITAMLGTSAKYIRIPNNRDYTEGIVQTYMYSATHKIGNSLYSWYPDWLHLIIFTKMNEYQADTKESFTVAPVQK